MSLERERAYFLWYILADLKRFYANIFIAQRRQADVNGLIADK